MPDRSVAASSAPLALAEAALVDGWPRTAASAFAARRSRFESALERLAGERSLRVERVLLASGLARPRNFAANPFPFRAESHFLYLVGAQLEDAYLLFDRRGASGGRWTLFVEPPDPEEALWSGPQRSLEQWAAELGLEVRPLAELEAPKGAVRRATATLPPQDALSAAALADFVGRDVIAGDGAELDGVDGCVADVMVELRLVHDEWALAQLRQAAAVTALAHEAGFAATRGARRATEIRAAMEARITAYGMTPGYGSIVTPHGEVLHATSSDVRLLPTDLLLADVGAETVEGFTADVTRSWPVSGRFEGAQRALYEVVLAAQEAVISAVRPGVENRDLHRLARRELTRGLSGLGLLRGEESTLIELGVVDLFFPHGIGHLLGLDVHDLEDLGDRAGYAPGRGRTEAGSERYLRLDRPLSEHMVITVEPGYYHSPVLLAEASAAQRSCVHEPTLAQLAGVRGIRIEDDVHVTSGEPEVLTAAIPKQMAALELSLR